MNSGIETARLVGGDSQDTSPALRLPPRTALGPLGATTENLNRILKLTFPQQLVVLQEIASLSLSDALLVTQRNSAIRWIERSHDETLKDAMRELAKTSFLATQAVSHIAPSSKGDRAAVSLDPSDGDFLLNGRAAWVTGIMRADYVTIGATMRDGKQTVAIIPKDRPGVLFGPHDELTTLQASETGWMKLDNVRVSRSEVLLNPEFNVITHQGERLVRAYPPLHTSAIALGHALGACAAAEKAVSNVSKIADFSAAIRGDVAVLATTVHELAQHGPIIDSQAPFEELRAAANVCAIRAADLLTIALRGRGLLSNSDAGGLVPESRFFLVWGLSPRTEELTLQKLLS